MGVYLDLINFDKKFHSLKRPPIIVNDIAGDSEVQREKLSKLLLTEHDSDGNGVNEIPSCDCGAITTTAQVGDDIVCAICNTSPAQSSNQSLDMRIWLRAPEGVVAMMNPNAYNLLSEPFTVNKFNIIQWLCDLKYVPPGKVPKVMESVLALNLPRGYNNFVNNFYDIIEKLCTIPEFAKKSGRNSKGKAKSKPPEIPPLEFWRNNKDSIFCHYLPIPNKTLLIVEKNSLNTFLDPIVPLVKDAVFTLLGIDLSNRKIKQALKEGDSINSKKTAIRERSEKQRLNDNQQRTFKVLRLLSAAYKMYYANSVARKEGNIRKGYLAARVPFSGRGVITPINGVHHYTEIHTPWNMSVTMLEYHITKILMDEHNYSPNEAKEFVYHHTNNYSDFLNQIFIRMIDEAPVVELWEPVQLKDGTVLSSLYPHKLHGIPALMNRPPTLAYGSIQLGYIAKIKTDLTDNSISFSTLVNKPYNADYDGDQMPVVLLMDNWTAERAANLRVTNSVFSLEAPEKISSTLQLPKPNTLTCSEFYRAVDFDPVKFERMRSLL